MPRFVTVFFCTLFLLSLGSLASAQDTFTVTVDSTMDDNAGFILSVVEVGYPDLDFFAFEEAGKIRFYAAREADTGIWDIFATAQYLVAATTMTIGDSWNFLVTENEMPTTAEVTAFESITTPAGTFSCYKVEIRLTSNLSLLDSIMWFSDGVGLVRQDYYGIENPGNAYTDTSQLQSFDSGGGNGFLPLIIGNTWAYDLSVSTHELSWGEVKALY